MLLKKKLMSLDVASPCDDKYPLHVAIAYPSFSHPGGYRIVSTARNVCKNINTACWQDISVIRALLRIYRAVRVNRALLQVYRTLVWGYGALGPAEIRALYRVCFSSAISFFRLWEKSHDQAEGIGANHIWEIFFIFYQLCCRWPAALEQICFFPPRLSCTFTVTVAIAKTQ